MVCITLCSNYDGLKIKLSTVKKYRNTLPVEVRNEVVGSVAIAVRPRFIYTATAA